MVMLLRLQKKKELTMSKTRMSYPKLPEITRFCKQIFFSYSFKIYPYRVTCTIIKAHAILQACSLLIFKTTNLMLQLTAG